MAWCSPAMMMETGKRPDGMSLIPWSRGLPLIWDFTCCDTLAPSNLFTSSDGSSQQANSAESAKLKKYSSLTSSFLFSLLCVEILGAWGSNTCSLAWWIGSWVMEQTGDNRATQFLIRKNSFCLGDGGHSIVAGLGRVAGLLCPRIGRLDGLQMMAYQFSV